MNKGKGELALVIIIFILVLMILGGIYYYINFIDVSNPALPNVNSGEGGKIDGFTIDTPMNPEDSGENDDIITATPSSGSPSNYDKHYVDLNKTSVRKLLGTISVEPSTLDIVASKIPDRFYEYELGYLKRDIEDYKLFFAVRYVSSSDTFYSRLYVQNGGGATTTICENNSIDVDSVIYTSMNDKYIYATIVNPDQSVTLSIIDSLFREVATYKLILGNKPLNIEVIDGWLYYYSYDTYAGLLLKPGNDPHKYANTYYKVSEVDGVLTRETLSVDDEDYVEELDKRED